MPRLSPVDPGAPRVLHRAQPRLPARLGVWAATLERASPCRGVTLTLVTYKILEYQRDDGTNPFAIWFDDLDAIAAARVTTALTRLAAGNTSDVKGVGVGVSEIKIDFGPGYREYFGKDGLDIVILLAGGTKQKQQADIETAQARWQDYKRRKAGGA
jgi:putative addiction module killer protein